MLTIVRESRLPKLSVFLWSALVATEFLSLFGFAFFVQHPERLAQWPGASEIFGYSYALFARLQIVLAAAVFFTELSRRVGTRWLLALLSACGISLAAETLGTATGLPFGHYSYTELLGPKFFDLVPVLIPVSWFFMALTAYGWVVHRGTQSRAIRVLAASILLSAWDLTLDPAMSRLSPFWLWETPGIYFGSPLLNLFGWFATGVAINLSFEWLRVGEWVRGISKSFFVSFYSINLALPVGLVLFAGLWQPVAISLVVLAVVVLLTRSSARGQNDRGIDQEGGVLKLTLGPTHTPLGLK